jgi:hypothetical protein
VGARGRVSRGGGGAAARSAVPSTCGPLAHPSHALYWCNGSVLRGRESSSRVGGGAAHVREKEDAGARGEGVRGSHAHAAPFREQSAQIRDQTVPICVS